MSYKKTLLAASTLFIAASLRGQDNVCDLFKDLKAADGRELVLTGELILSKDLGVLGAADCDNRFITAEHYVMPTAVALRPSPSIPAEAIEKMKAAIAEADRLRLAGKTVSASGSFAGRLRLVSGVAFPAELMFDAIEDIKVETLPDPSELPVIPICDLFRDLTAWKGKRIAVRGESVSTSEGSWITGNCKGEFYTNGYRWPVSLNNAGPAFYSNSIASLIGVKRPSDPPKGWDQFRGRNNATESATYVGRLRMRSEYIAVCRAAGDYLAYGFGHLGGAAAELIVEAVSDVELTAARPRDEIDYGEKRCTPPNQAALCAAAKTLDQAAVRNCIDRTRELLAKEGIDSKDGSESSALLTAIRFADEAIVKLLLNAGAPVNPVKVRLWQPLTQAAYAGRIGMIKILIQSGANVDAQDGTGLDWALDARVAKVLLEAGADPNVRDRQGETALMQASNYGLEDTVKILIEHGALVNVIDNRGRSPLMHAAAGEYVDAIPYLLAHGADLDARDRDGKTALDIAKDSKNKVAEELLSAAIRH